MSRVKRTCAYISLAKVKNVHFLGFQPVCVYKVDISEIYCLSVCLLMYVQRAIFTFLFYSLIYLYYAGLWTRNWRFRDQVLPCCQLCYFTISVTQTFGITLSWTANSFSAEPWLDFMNNAFMSGGKVHSLGRRWPFLPKFCLFAFFKQQVPKTWRKNRPT